MDMAKPIIRFKGYQDDWEQRKLGDVVDSVDTGKSRFDKEGSSGEYPILGSTSVIGYDDEYDYEGDFILTARVGANAGSLYRHAGKVKISDNTVFIQASQNIEFLYQLLIQFDIKKLSFGTGQPLVKASELKSLELMMPTDMKEQMRIGVYFKNLDTLITLHQRKCDETKKLKKYMLQKMFPQNGEKVPEIRFSGFTDDWEQRKLEDIAEFSKGSGYSKGDLIESGTPIILYGRLYTKYETSISEVDTYVEAKDGSVYSKGGEVIVPASGETAEDIARAATVNKSGVILGGDLNVVSPNEDINSAFLAISISHGNSQRELAKKAQGKSVVHIHNEEIKNLVVPFPANAEQNKIVEYFSNLDHLITLHQRELENLQNIKKFMLGKMFV